LENEILMANNREKTLRTDVDKVVQELASSQQQVEKLREELAAAQQNKVQEQVEDTTGESAAGEEGQSAANAELQSVSLKYNRLCEYSACCLDVIMIS
jgi:predicted  nucleic acid-binding Zn-ribbon protein